MLDAINTGLLDCMNSGIDYFVTKDPAFGLVADLNAGYENPEQLEAWLRQGGAAGGQPAGHLCGAVAVYAAADRRHAADAVFPAAYPLAAWAARANKKPR